MWLLAPAVIALILKLLGIPRQIENLSWWWIAAAFGVAFIWFEFVEHWLGLDKKRVFDEFESAKQERLRRYAKQNRRGKGR
jgi:small Trp-rich protein